MQLKKNSFLSYLQRGARRCLWVIGFRPYCYTSIDEMPYYYWRTIHETGDITGVMPNNKFPLTQKLLDQCSEIWDDIRQQHLDAFGISQEYSRYLKLTADLAIAELQYAISGSNWDLMILDFAKADLGEIKDSPKEDHAETKALIEKHWLNGQRLDEKLTTVREYFTYIRSLQKQTSNGS